MVHHSESDTERLCRRLNGEAESRRLMTLARKRNRRRHPAARADAATVDSITFAYFFLPLETPLSIPNESIIKGQERPSPKKSFESEFLDVAWDEDEGLFGCRISCRFHHVHTAEVDTLQHAAFEAVRVAFPSSHIPRDPSAPKPLRAVVTVAEVAVLLPADSDDALGDALDEAVDFVAGIQRVYSVMAHEPIPIVSRSRLPLLVPYALRIAVHDEDEPRWPGPDDIRVLFPREPHIAELATAPSDESPARFTLRDLSDAQEPVLDGPFRHVHESWRNANVALRQGDFAVAAILAGVACEQTIRALLLCLLWEDDFEPVEAGRVLHDNKGRTKNINEVLVDLIKRLSAIDVPEDAAQAMAIKVLDLRNRVLHRAYQPTEAEARMAMDQCAKFATWTRDATLAKLERYPVTFAMSVSGPILDSEAAARLDAALTSNLWPTRPNVNLSNYQFEVDRYSPGNESMRERFVYDLSDIDWVSTSLTYPNGTTRWFCLDETRMLAYVAKPPACLSGKDRRLLRDLSLQTAETIDEFGHQPTIVSRWLHVELEPQAGDPYLHSWYKISPLDQAGRYARCPTPNIPADSPVVW